MPSVEEYNSDPETDDFRKGSMMPYQKVVNHSHPV